MEFVLLGVVFILIVLLLAIPLILRKTEVSETWKKDVRKKVAQLDHQSKSNDAIHLTACIVDADKLMDHVLKSRRVSGETMGERLKNARGLFPRDTYEGIWQGHKLRNKIAHEIDYRPSVWDLKLHYTNLRSGILYGLS